MALNLVREHGAPPIVCFTQMMLLVQNVSFVSYCHGIHKPGPKYSVTVAVCPLQFWPLERFSGDLFCFGQCAKLCLAKALSSHKVFRLSAHSYEGHMSTKDVLMWVDSGQRSASLQNNLMHGPFALLLGPLDGRILRTVSPPSSWENRISSSPNLLLFLWEWYWKPWKQCLFTFYMQSYHLYINHILGCDFFSYFITTDINNIPNIFCNVYLILKICIFFLSLFLGQNSLFFFSISSYFHSDICYSMNAI